MNPARIAPLLIASLLSACSGERDPGPAADNAASATPAAATPAPPRLLIPADLDLAGLGAKVVGPQGTDFEGTVTADTGEFATVRAFVACPRGMTVCDPATAPARTLYTYVITLTPTPKPAPDPTGETTPPFATASASATPAATAAGATLFRMTRAAPGFQGSLGFVRAEAERALGKVDPIVATLEDGQVIWKLADGATWQPGSPVTLWWQSTAAPAGPQPAYRLELAGESVEVTAPFPGDGTATSTATATPSTGETRRP